MSVHIDVDATLLAEAMAVVGFSSREAVVEEALRQLIADHRRRLALEELYGMGWEGDLDVMREGRAADQRS